MYDYDLVVFLVNRSADSPVEVTIDTSRAPVTGVLEALSLHDDDRLAVNTAQHPDRVIPKPNESMKLEEGRVTVTLPAIS